MQRVTQQVVSWLITKLSEFVEVSPDDISMSAITSGTVTLSNIRMRTAALNRLLLPNDVAQIFEITHCSVGALTISLPLLSYDVSQPIEVTLANVQASGALRPRDASSSGSTAGGAAGAASATTTSSIAAAVESDAAALSLRRLFGQASAAPTEGFDGDDDEEERRQQKEEEERKAKEQQQQQSSWLWSAVGAVANAVTYVLPPHPSKRPVRLNLTNVSLFVSAGATAATAAGTSTRNNNNIHTSSSTRSSSSSSSVAQVLCEGATVRIDADEHTWQQSISVEMARGLSVVVKNKNEPVLRVAVSLSLHSSVSSHLAAAAAPTSNNRPQQQQQQQQLYAPSRSQQQHRRWTVRITDCRAVFCDNLLPLLCTAQDFCSELLVPVPMRPHRYLLSMGSEDDGANNSSNSSSRELRAKLRARSRFMYAARCVHALIQSRNRRWQLKTSAMRDARFACSAYLRHLAEVYEDGATQEALDMHMADLQQLEAGALRHGDVIAFLRSVALGRATQLHVAGRGPSVPLPVNEDYYQSNNNNNKAGKKSEKFSVQLSIPLISVSMPLSFRATVVNLGVTLHSKGLLAKGTAISAQFHAAELHHEKKDGASGDNSRSTSGAASEQQRDKNRQQQLNAAAAAAVSSGIPPNLLQRPSLSLRIVSAPPLGAAVAPQSSMALQVHFVIPSRVLRSGGRITCNTAGSSAADFFADQLDVSSSPTGMSDAMSDGGGSKSAASGLSRTSTLAAATRLLHTVGRRSAASGVMEIAATVGIVDCRAELLKLAALELMPSLEAAGDDIRKITFMSSLSLRCTRLLSQAQKLAEERKKLEAEEKSRKLQKEEELKQQQSRKKDDGTKKSSVSRGTTSNSTNKQQRQMQQSDFRPVAFTVSSPQSAAARNSSNFNSSMMGSSGRVVGNSNNNNNNNNNSSTFAVGLHPGSALLSQSAIDAFVATQQPVTPTVLRLNVEALHVFLPEFLLGVDARELKAVLPDSTFERERRHQQLERKLQTQPHEEKQNKMKSASPSSSSATQQQQPQRRKEREEIASPFPESFTSLASSIDLQWLRVWHGPMEILASSSAATSSSSSSSSTLVRDHIPLDNRHEVLSLRVVSRSTISVLDIVVCGIPPSTRQPQQSSGESSVSGGSGGGSNATTPIVLQLTEEYIGAVKQRVVESVAKMPTLDDLFVSNSKAGGISSEQQRESGASPTKKKAATTTTTTTASPTAAVDDKLQHQKQIAAAAPRPGLRLSVPSFAVTCSVSAAKLPGTVRPLLLRLDGLSVKMPPVGEIPSDSNDVPAPPNGRGVEAGAEEDSGSRSSSDNNNNDDEGVDEDDVAAVVLSVRFKALRVQLPYPASIRVGCTAVTCTDDGAIEVTVTNTAIEVQQQHPAPATFQLGTVKRLTVRAPGPLDVACAGLTLLDQAVAVEELAVRITPIAGHVPQHDQPTVGTDVHVALAVLLVDVPNAMLCPAPKIVGDIYDKVSVIVWDAMSTAAKSEFMSVQANVHVELNVPEMGGTAVRFGEAEARIVRWNPTKAASTLSPVARSPQHHHQQQQQQRLTPSSKMRRTATADDDDRNNRQGIFLSSPNTIRGSGAILAGRSDSSAAFGIDEDALQAATETIVIDYEHFGDCHSPLAPPSVPLARYNRASPPPHFSATRNPILSRLSQSALRGEGGATGAAAAAIASLGRGLGGAGPATAAEQWLMSQQQQQQLDPYILEPTAVVITQSLRPRLLTIDVTWDVDRRGLRVDVSAVDENAVSCAAAAEAAAAMPSSSSNSSSRNNNSDDDDIDEAGSNAKVATPAASSISAGAAGGAFDSAAAAAAATSAFGNNQLGILLKVRKPQAASATVAAAAAAAAGGEAAAVADETDMLLLCVTLSHFSLIESLADPNPPVVWKRSEYPPTLQRIGVGGELTAFYVRRTKSRTTNASSRSNSTNNRKATSVANNSNNNNISGMGLATASTLSSTATPTPSQQQQRQRQHSAAQAHQQKKRRGTQQTTTPALHVVVPSLCISNNFVIASEDPVEHDAEVRRAALGGKRRPGIAYDVFDKAVAVSRVAGGLCDVAAVVRCATWVAQEWLPPLNCSLGYASDVPLDAVKISEQRQSKKDKTEPATATAPAAGAAAANQAPRRFQAERDDVLVVPRNSGSYTVFAANADVSTVAVLIDGRNLTQTQQVPASAGKKDEAAQQQQQHQQKHQKCPVPVQRHATVRLSAVALDFCVSHRSLDEKITLRLGSVAVDARRATPSDEKTAIEVREIELVLLSRPLLALAAVDVSLAEHLGFTSTIHASVTPSSTRAPSSSSSSAGFNTRGGANNHSFVASSGHGDICINVVDIICFAAAVQHRVTALQQDLHMRHDHHQQQQQQREQQQCMSTSNASIASSSAVSAAPKTTTKRSESSMIWYSEQCFRILSVDTAVRPAGESFSLHLSINSDLSVAIVDHVLPLATVHLKSTSVKLHKSTLSSCGAFGTDLPADFGVGPGDKKPRHSPPFDGDHDKTAMHGDYGGESTSSAVDLRLATTCSVSVHAVQLDSVLSGATVTAHFASAHNRRLAVAVDVEGAKLEPRWHHAPLLVWWVSQVMALLADRLEHRQQRADADDVVDNDDYQAGASPAASMSPLPVPSVVVVDRTGSDFHFIGFGTGVIVPGFGSVDLASGHKSTAGGMSSAATSLCFPLAGIDLDTVTLLTGASVSSTAAASSFSPAASPIDPTPPASRAASPTPTASLGCSSSSASSFSATQSRRLLLATGEHSIEGSRTHVPALLPVPSFMPSDIVSDASSSGANRSSTKKSGCGSASSVLPFCTPLMRFRHGDKVAFLRVSRVGLCKIVVELVPPVVLQNLLTTAPGLSNSSGSVNSKQSPLGELRLGSGLPAAVALAAQQRTRKSGNNGNNGGVSADKSHGHTDELISLPVIDDDPLPAPPQALLMLASSSASVDMSQLDGELVLLLSVPEKNQQQHRQQHYIASATIPLTPRSLAQLSSSPFLTKTTRTLCKARFDLVFKRAHGSSIGLMNATTAAHNNSNRRQNDDAPIYAFAELVTSGHETCVLRIRSTMQIRNETGLPLRIVCNNGAAGPRSGGPGGGHASPSSSVASAAFDGCLAGGTSNVPDLPVWCQSKPQHDNGSCDASDHQKRDDDDDDDDVTNTATLLSVDPSGGPVEMKISLAVSSAAAAGDDPSASEASSPASATNNNNNNPNSALGQVRSFLQATLGAHSFTAGSSSIGDGVAAIPFFFPETADGEPAMIHEINLPSARRKKKQWQNHQQQQRHHTDDPNNSNSSSSKKKNVPRLFGRWEEEGRVFVLRRMHPTSSDAGLVVVRNTLPSTMVTMLVGSSDPSKSNDTLWIPPCACVTVPPIDAAVSSNSSHSRRSSDSNNIDDEDGEEENGNHTMNRCWIVINNFKPTRVDFARASKNKLGEPLFVDLEPAVAGALPGRIALTRVAPGWFDIVPWCIIVTQPSSSPGSSNTSSGDSSSSASPDILSIHVSRGSAAPQGAGMECNDKFDERTNSHGSCFGLLCYSDDALWNFSCQSDQPVAFGHTIFGAAAASSLSSNNEQQQQQHKKSKNNTMRLHPAQLAQRVASSTTLDPQTGVSVVHFTRDWWTIVPVRVTLRNLSSVNISVRTIVLSAEMDQGENSNSNAATRLPALLSSSSSLTVQHHDRGSEGESTHVSAAASAVSFIVNIDSDDDDDDDGIDDEVEIFCSYSSKLKRYEGTSVITNHDSVPNSNNSGGGGRRSKNSVRNLDFFLVNNSNKSSRNEDKDAMRRQHNSVTTTSYLYVTDRGSSVAVASGPDHVDRIADSKAELLTNLLTNPAVDLNLRLQLRSVSATVWGSSVPNGSSAEPFAMVSVRRCIVLCRNRPDVIHSVTTDPRDVKRFEISGETSDLTIKELEEQANPRRMYASLPPTTLSMRSYLRFVDLAEPPGLYNSSSSGSGSSSNSSSRLAMTRQLRERRALGCIIHVMPITVSRISGSLGLHVVERAELAFPIAPVLVQVALLTRVIKFVTKSFSKSISSKTNESGGRSSRVVAAPPPPPPEQLASSATPAGVQPGVYLSTADFVFYEVAANAVGVHCQLAQDMGYDDLALHAAASARALGAASTQDLVTPQNFHFEYEPHTIRVSVAQQQQPASSSVSAAALSVLSSSSATASLSSIQRLRKRGAAPGSILLALAGSGGGGASAAATTTNSAAVLYIRGSMHKFGMPVEMLAIAAARHYGSSSAGQLSRNLASIHELAGSPLGMLGEAFMTTLADLATTRSSSSSSRGGGRSSTSSRAPALLPVAALIPVFASEVIGRSLSAIAGFASSLLSQQAAVPAPSTRLPTASPQFHALNEHWAGFPPMHLSSSSPSSLVSPSSAVYDDGNMVVAQGPHAAVRWALASSLRELLSSAEPYFIIRVLPTAIAATRLKYAFLLRTEHRAWISGDTATAALLLGSSTAEAQARKDIALCQRLVSGAPARRDAAVLAGPEGFLQVIRDEDPKAAANPLSAASHVSLVALRSSVLRWGALAPRLWPRFVEAYCRAVVKFHDDMAGDRN